MILGTALMVGCAVQKPVIEEAVTHTLLEQGIALVDSLPSRPWQEVFVDEPLRVLIAEELDSNADVRTMRLNVEQAAQQMRVAKLSYLPTFALSPSATATKAQSSTATYNYELPLTMSWELNLGGQVEAQKEATKYQWMNTQEQLGYTRQQLIASVANAYYTLVMLDEQLRISEQSVQLQRETLEAIRTMKDVGMMNELAVNQAETELQATVASVSDLRLQRDKTQRAFRYGATEKFGLRDDHYEEDGEIISRASIEESIDDANAETYRILLNGEIVGGAVISVDGNHGELELLFVNPKVHSKGIGYAAWCLIEQLHPEVTVWETTTPYFEKRNIHFYVNRCGFHIVEYFNHHHPAPNDSDSDDTDSDDMFRLQKVIVR